MIWPGFAHPMRPLFPPNSAPFPSQFSSFSPPNSAPFPSQFSPFSPPYFAPSPPNAAPFPHPIPFIVTGITFVGTVVIHNTNSSGHHLFMYMLDHEKQYKMRAVKMNPIQDQQDPVMEQVVSPQANAKDTSYEKQKPKVVVSAYKRDSTF